MTKIILNADDFGYSFLFNKMILELVDEGVIRSSSVMVDEITREQKVQVVELAKYFKGDEVGVGLHVYFKSKNFRSEIIRQFQKFEELFGLQPTHIDLHKLDYIEDGYLAIQEFCIENEIPTINLSLLGGQVLDGVITTKTPAYNGTQMSYEDLVKLIDNFDDDTYNLVFHPGYFDPESKSSLNKERETDASKLRKLKDWVQFRGIKIISFKDLMVDGA